MNTLSRLYQATVPIVAALVFVVAMYLEPVPDYHIVVAFAVATFLAEWNALALSVRGTVSLSYAIIYAAILLGGPTAGAIVAIAGAVTPQDVLERRHPRIMAFNIGQMALYALVAGLFQDAIGLTPLLIDSAAHSSLVWLVLAFSVGVVLAGTNMLLFGVYLVLEEEITPASLWPDLFRPVLPGFLSFVLLGVVLAHVSVLTGVLGALLLVVPFVISRQTLEVYQRLVRTYKETVRALGTALEAKDLYTNGHSERVACYARGAAAHLGFSLAQTERVERAALLHDIGKVAISGDVLRKESGLSTDEYVLVKSHPTVAVDLLGDIELLEDVLPIVRAHHERLDGSGYPDGLRGAALPLEAQVLAVADCYDAMTSDRPYRKALARSAAESELLRMAEDGQLDAAVVEALLVTTAIGSNRPNPEDSHAR